MKVGYQAIGHIIELPKDSYEVIEMNICEVEHIVLRANKLYRFLIDPNCEKCKKMNVY